MGDHSAIQWTNATWNPLKHMPTAGGRGWRRGRHGPEIAVAACRGDLREIHGYALTDALVEVTCVTCKRAAPEAPHGE